MFWEVRTLQTLGKCLTIIFNAVIVREVTLVATLGMKQLDQIKVDEGVLHAAESLIFVLS